jgi:DNA-binding transcriptional regulator LsrR (DeoR family)
MRDAAAGAAAADVPAERMWLLTKVAQMYHERGMRQADIAADLQISQPRVSRLLKQAAAAGIVRTVVIAPRGVHTDLAEAVQQRYGLSEVVVADSGGMSEESAVTRAIASAAAVYLETSLGRDDRIGVSSWSATLLAAVEAMRPTDRAAARVVQILGGLGRASAQSRATRLTGGLAQNVHAEADYLVAPGLVATPAMREALVREPIIAAVREAWEDLTVALVGVGSFTPAALLRESGNAITAEEERSLRALGAVGDVCMRFFDHHGRHIASGIDDRVLGIGPAVFKRVPRRVGVAGGARKWPAIRAAVTGGWLNVLVTDHGTALELLRGQPGGVPVQPMRPTPPNR